MNPLISVIVPVYNVENYLDQCVQSVVNQTYSNLQIVLIDDGSPDHCPQMCDAWAKKDSRIQVIHQKNQGVSAARNAGLQVAEGDWIGFVDSDDMLPTNAYETILKIAEMKNVELIFYNYYSGIKKGPSGTSYISNGSSLPTGMIDRKAALELVFFSASCKGYIWNKLFSKTLFAASAPPRFQTNISFCEDLLFAVQCVLNSQKIFCMDTPLYFYNVSPNSAVHSPSSKYNTALNAFAEIISIMPKGIDSYAYAAYVSMAGEILYRCYEKCDKNGIQTCRSIIKKYWPHFYKHRDKFSSKTYFRILGSRICAPVFCRTWNFLKTSKVQPVK